jgi:hypothetical protein
MPRFFFDIYDGDLFMSDETGQELDDLEAAKVEAQKALPEMAKDNLPDSDQRAFIVSVRDGAGQVVLRIALSMIVEYPSQASE